MSGTILVAVLSLAAYVAGVPLWALIVFVVLGTCLEYFWLGKKKN